MLSSADDSIHGLAVGIPVGIPTNHREIPGSTPGRYNLQIEITSELAPTKRQLTWTVYASPLMTLTTDLNLSIRVSMFEYVRLMTGTSS